MIALPPLPCRSGLGLGLDLPWVEDPGPPRPGVAAAAGFITDPARGERPTDALGDFLARTAGDFVATFVSWQPKNRSKLRLEDYAPAWDELFSLVPAGPRGAVRSLHQTTFNLGALEPYPRAAICDFTNALARRYDLKWVNEDLGLWSLNGRPLPYPLPPWLTEAGLAAAIRNVREVVDRLEIPLLVEFPGFSDGTSVYVGHLDAYDFFRVLAEEAEVAVTLDIGHLLSWRWIRGFRGEALFGDLERLPLAHCAEIHLSGCALEGEAFLDYHHGVLLAEQLELLERLLPRCPELRVVTYEDPRFDGFGELLSETRAGHRALVERVRAWSRDPS